MTNGKQITIAYIQIDYSLSYILHSTLLDSHQQTKI